MAIVKMKHLRLIAMVDDREEILRLLQQKGCVEIDEASVERMDRGGPPDDPERAELLSRLEAELTHPETGGLAARRERGAAVDRALGVLKKQTPEKGGLLQPRPSLTVDELFDEESARTALQGAEEINEADRRIHAIQAEQAKRMAQKAILAPWLPLDLPLDTRSTELVTIQLGTLPLRVPFAQAEEAVMGTGDLAQLTLVSTDREQQYLVLVCHSSQSPAALEALKDLGWSRANLREWTGTAKESTDRLDGELEELAREQLELEEKLAGMSALRPGLKQLADRTAVEISREESRGRMLDTAQTFYLDGWVPAEAWPKLEQALSGYTCAAEAADPTPEEYPKVPVQLKNSVFTRCMNVVTEMYSLPAYDGVDPNPLMAPFFILFFGVMMADMAYGLLMILASAVYLRKAKPKNPAFMEMIFWCGISTFIVGALTGGFFGDFIPQLLSIVDPSSTFEMPALLSPLNDIVTIMIGSLILGVIQIFTGMAVSTIKKCREGQFIDALFSEITWWIILAGLAAWVCGMLAPGAPAALGMAGKGLLLAGALMLVFGGTRNAKGFGKVTCLVGLVYNGVTGYFSDILSYIRLMALMVSGSVIASVFNTLGATFGNVVLFVLISMVGNLLNLALNLLGCYVHDLRLQCLEFFGRFYQEGGRPYRPLSIQTNYVDIMREEL